MLNQDYNVIRDQCSLRRKILYNFVNEILYFGWRNDIEIQADPDNSFCKN